MSYQNFRQIKAIEQKNSKEKSNFVGMRFGRLIVIERVDNARTPNGKSQIMYRCKCDCGNEKIIRKCHLASGKILSCGCLHREKLGNMRRKHGFSHKERLYSLWISMKDRCYNENNVHYHSYGGRGISVCEEWKNDYISFRNWCISNGYREEIRKSGRNNLTIDRIDVNGNYEPSNCRFLTNKENCLNKRDTMTDEERYKICPVCGKKFEIRRRNEKQTCSTKCGQVIKKIHYTAERNLDGTFKKTKL